MIGLNSLTGFNVTSFNISLLPSPSDGSNMHGTVLIPNPSPMTLSMGNVTFDNYIASPNHTLIGNSTLTNLVLKPGDNIVPMRSTVDQATVISQPVSTFKDGRLPVDIVARSVVYGGERIAYFEEALKAVNQSVTLDVGRALKAIGVDISGEGGGL